MLKGSYTLLGIREIEGRNGTKFKVGTFGDIATCSKFDMFIPKDLSLPDGLTNGQMLNIALDLEQNGFELRGTLKEVTI